MKLKNCKAGCNLTKLAGKTNPSFIESTVTLGKINSDLVEKSPTCQC